MKLGLNSNLIRKGVFLIALPGVFSVGSLFAQDSYYEDEHARPHHQRDEKHDLKHHQKEERYSYGNSWELRQHQREERRQLRDHREDERDYREPSYGYSGRDREYSPRSDRGYSDGYSRRPY